MEWSNLCSHVVFKVKSLPSEHLSKAASVRTYRLAQLGTFRSSYIQHILYCPNAMSHLQERVQFHAIKSLLKVGIAPFSIVTLQPLVVVQLQSYSQVRHCIWAVTVVYILHITLHSIEKILLQTNRFILQMVWAKYGPWPICEDRSGFIILGCTHFIDYSESPTVILVSWSIISLNLVTTMECITMKFLLRGDHHTEVVL